MTFSRHGARRAAAALCLAGCLAAWPAAGEAPLAEKPYMGWSSWSFFRGRPTEGRVKAEADAMSARLKAYGYVYINVDSGWSEDFDGYGRARPDAARFPGGIAALAEYVHRKGLKLGIYLNPGMPKSVWDANSPIYGTPYHARDISDASQNGNTFGKANRIDYLKPGAAEYVQSCADLVASWGVDFIKMDFVGPGAGRVPADNRPDIQHWNAALKKTGRPVWLELSNSLDIRYVDFWKKYSNSWRIEADIEWYGGHTLTNWNRVSRRFDNAPNWAPHAGPGGWNDLDALEVGNGINTGLTPDERRTAMTLWCINCSPLSIGADLTNLDRSDLSILTNPEVLAIDQAGRVAVPLSQGSAQQVWRARNPDGTFTVALFNLGASAETVTANWNEVGFHSPAAVRDLWARTELGVFGKGFAAALNGHAARLLRVTPLVMSAEKGHSR